MKSEDKIRPTLAAEHPELAKEVSIGWWMLWGQLGKDPINQKQDNIKAFKFLKKTRKIPCMVFLDKETFQRIKNLNT